MKTGRNDPCPCGSGAKYKKCCAEKDAAQRAADAEANAPAADEPKAEAETVADDADPAKRKAGHLGDWMRQPRSNPSVRRKGQVGYSST